MKESYVGIIQNGYSPCVEDIIEYLKSWADARKVSQKQHVTNTLLQ